MAIGQDYECINIKAAQYNREKRIREEEARREAEYRAELARRRKIAAAKAAAERERAEQRRKAYERAERKEARRRVVRSMMPVAASGHTGSVSVGEEYGIGSLINDNVKTGSRLFKIKWNEYLTRYFSRTAYTRVRVGTHRAVPIAFVGYLAVFAVIAGMLLVGNARVSSAKSGNNVLKARIAAAETAGKALDEQLERGMDASYVEAYAVGELGMVKKSEVSRKYITFGGEEKIVSGVSD